MRTLTIGDELALRAEKPVAGGAMLARHDGRIVFLTGAIPGELVRVRIDRLARGFAHGTVLEVVEADPDRRDVSADPGCGGRAYAHIGYERQLTLKRDVIRDTFQRIARLALPEVVAVSPSPERGYRMRARLHVRGARVGFVREGTHDLCDAGQTEQLSAATLHALASLESWLEDAEGGQARTIELAENIEGDQRAVHLTTERRPRRIDVQAMESSGVTGISWSPPDTTQAHVVMGSPYVTDPLDTIAPGHATGTDGVVMRRHVRAFFQANRFLLRDVVSTVLQHVGREKPVVDLYAGVGLYAVGLAAAGRRVLAAVEGDRWSGADLEVNAAALGRPIEIRRTSVERYLSLAPACEDLVVVLNPPRTGLSRLARAGVQRLRPARIVYVSCDLPTLARDVRTFCDGGYELSGVQAFDLFPATAHVETVVVLTRADA